VSTHGVGALLAALVMVAITAVFRLSRKPRPFQVLQSATVNPAKFLGEENEFGTVTIGKRADLLLVKDNPLTDLQTTRKPDGIMLRGVLATESETATDVRRLAISQLSHPSSVL